MQPAAQTSTAPGLADYIELLKRHDWAYEYTEDSRVYRAGRAQRDALLAMRVALDPTGEVWNQHAPADYRFTKPAPRAEPARPAGSVTQVWVLGLPFYVSAIGGFVVQVKINGGWLDACYAVGAALLNDLQKAYEGTLPAKEAA